MMAQDPAVADLYLGGLDSYDALNPVERLRFSSLMYNLIWHFEITLALHEEGVSTDTRLEAQLATVLERLEHPSGAKWWDDAKLDSQVRAFIESRRREAG